MEESKSYNVNFFKPSTPFLKENIRAIVIGLVIWGVVTYGFQILLRIMETPTPEAAYVEFQEIAPKLTDGSASPEEMAKAASFYLAMLGKSAALLQNEQLKVAFTSTAHNALAGAEQQMLLDLAGKAGSGEAMEAGFIHAALGIAENKAMMAVVPFALTAVTPDNLVMYDPATKPLMDKYFIHNQSVLTDSIVFGFPFHYFFTALVTLVVFVLICLWYCGVMDKMMKKHGMEQSFE
jgi:putative solute:sodium symporter small subunit